jgi:tellurite methyltransferase
VEQDRVKWNGRYAGEGFFLGQDPSPFLVERISLIESLAPGRRALDIACGEGRNSIFLARHGFAVTGLDISGEGIAKGARRVADEGLTVDLRQVDLQEYHFAESWDLIINFNFLLRDLIPEMVASLNPGGVIVFDTILDSPLLVGHHNKAFLLQPGELAALFARFPGRIVHADERHEGPSPTARLIFQKSCA